MATGTDIGYYTIPVILSMEGIDKQVNSKLGKGFGDVGKKASKALGDGLKTTEADIKKATDNYQKFRDKAEDALGKVRKDEAALQDLRSKGITSGSRWVAAEERLATSRRNSTRATKEAWASHGALKDSQDKLGKSTGDLGGKMSGLKAGAATAGKALAGAGVVAAGAATAGIALLAAGLVVATKAMYDLGAEFDSAMDNIRIKTGATGDALEGMSKKLDSLAPHIAAPIEAISDVMADVQRHLHVTGTDFDNITRTIADFNRITGETLNIKDFGKVLRQFNIPAKDQVKVMDSLFRVWQKTGIPVNDLLSTLTKNGAALSALNIPLEVAVGLIAQLEDAGVDSEKAMAGLTKATAYFADKNVPLAEGLQRTVDAIKNAGSTAEAVNIAGDIFGTKNAANWVQAIRSGNLDLKTMQKLLDGSGDTIAQASEDTADWEETWAKLKNTVKVFLRPVGETVFNGINAQLEKLTTWVKEHQDEVITRLGDVVESSIRGLQNVLGVIQKVIGFLRDTLESIDDLPGIEFDTTPLDKAVAVLEDGKNAMNPWIDKVDEYSNRMAKAAKLTQAAGDATLDLNETTGDVEISSNAPEVQASLRDIGFRLDELKDHPGTFRVTADTPEAQAILDAFKATQGIGPGDNPDATLDVDADTSQADKNMKDLFDKYPMLDPNAPPPPTTDIPVDVNPGSLLLPPGGGPPGDMGDYGGMPGTFASKGLMPNALSVGSEIASVLPNMAIGGKRSDPHPDHPSGKALDVMVGDNPQGKALGDKLFGHYYSDPRIKSMIWQQTYHVPATGYKKLMASLGNRTGDHYDHIHMLTKKLGGGIPGYGGGDIIPALLEPGEHVLTKQDVAAMGGHQNVYEMRNALEAGMNPFQTGGNVDAHGKPLPVGPQRGDPTSVPLKVWQWIFDKLGMEAVHFQTGGRVPDWDAIAQKESGGRWNLPSGDRDSTGGLQIRKGTWDDFGGPALTGHEFPYQATREQQIAIAERILASQGPEAWAGGKNFVWKAADGSTSTTSGGGYTPATGPTGEPGYRTPPNPEDITSAKEEVSRSKSLLEAAKARLATVQADTEATEQQKVAAMAERDNAQADLDEANAKLSEAQVGEFTAGDIPDEPFPGWRNVPATASDIASAVGEVTAAQGELNTALAERADMDATGPIGEELFTDEQRKAQDDKIAQLREELRLAKEHEKVVRGGTYEEGPGTEGGKDKSTEYDANIQALGQLPGMMVNGLLETLGIGDIFPDLTQTPAWKSIAGGISAFKGPIQGLVEGKLGIQQPGWQPGQPIPGSGQDNVEGGGGGLTVPLPFGLPDIPLPARPEDQAHGAAGGAPPGPVQHNDMSFTVNGDVIDGADRFIPRAEQDQSRAIQRLPVLPGGPN